MNYLLALTSVLLLGRGIASAAPALQSSDWPMWGRNPANTRFNADESAVPPMTEIWNVSIAGTTQNDGAANLGKRYGVIVDGKVYGSYVVGNKTTFERRNLLTSVVAPGDGFPKTQTSRATYFSPTFSNNTFAFSLGGASSPCSGGASLYLINTAFATATTVSLSPGPFTPGFLTFGGRGAFGGTAANGYYYFSGFCPTSALPVRTAAYSFVTPGLKSWMSGPTRPYREFLSGESLASFSPAVDAGRVALALARRAGTCTPYMVGRLVVIDDVTGNDKCSFGPLAFTQFFDTPPSLNANHVYAANYDSLGVAAFDLTKCALAPGNAGTCNLVTGSSGANGRQQGFATDGNFVVVAAAGPFGNEVQIYSADMSSLISTTPWTDVLSPSVAIAKGHIYCVEDGLTNAGRPVAFEYNVFTGAFAATPAFVGSGTTSTPPVANAIAAIGEGVLLVSSAHNLTAYQLTPPPPPSAGVVTPTVCPPGPNNLFLAMDTGFDHMTGLLADARLMGTSTDNTGNIIGQFGMVYDTLTDTWNCFSPTMSIPPAETCPAIYTSGLSVVDNNETWALGAPTGCPSGGNLYAWKMSPSTPPTWSAGMQGATAGSWNAVGGFPIAMVRGVPGPRTGWAGISNGAAYFDAAVSSVSWSDPVADVGAGAGFFKMSMAYGSAVDGWAVSNIQVLAYLDTVTYPAPGKWVVPNIALQQSYGGTLGVWVNAADDVWGCGVFPNGQPMITHTTTPAQSGGIPSPIPGTIQPTTGPQADPNNCPALWDITFYELDPNHMRGVAVGGTQCAPAGVGPIVYVTQDHGQNWQLLPVTVPANYALVHLRGVRFVDATHAYAWGHAYDNASTFPIPLLVKVTIP